jgi:hypothetical protein
MFSIATWRLISKHACVIFKDVLSFCRCCWLIVGSVLLVMCFSLALSAVGWFSRNTEQQRPMLLHNVGDNSMPTVTMVVKRKQVIGHEIYYRGLIPVRGIRSCFRHLVHTCSGAHLASYPIHIGTPFSWSFSNCVQ